jgi:hypothetical protein
MFFGTTADVRSWREATSLRSRSEIRRWRGLHAGYPHAATAPIQADNATTTSLITSGSVRPERASTWKE